MGLPKGVLVALVAGAALTVGSASPPTGGARFERMRGVCWEGRDRVGPEALVPLQQLGVDWISQTPFGWCGSRADPQIRLNDGLRGLWGESDEGLASTARFARALGIRTLLKPHLWLRGGEWVGEIEMRSEEDWRTWFRSYEAFILHYARLAEREGMEGLAVGSELPKASRRTSDWRRVIARVREVYRGPLTYCANWHEAEGVAFWEALDYVGVQAYYPLRVPARPAAGEIRAAWSPVVARLERLARSHGPARGVH